MAGSTTAELSRVTIVAPQTRVDLAIPAEVPLAEILPTVLEMAGDGLADDPEAQHGWCLSRLGAPALDIARTPNQLEIRDGELLYLRPRHAQAPEPVFDDVVDAVATATLSRPGRWQESTTRRFGVALGVLALLGGVAVTAFAGPPHLFGVLVAFVLMIVLVGAASVAGRGFGNELAAVVLGLTALAYAAVVGGLLLAGDRPVMELAAPHLLLAAAVVIPVSAVTAFAVGRAAHVFLAASMTAAALGIGAAVSLLRGVTPAGSAAVVVAVALASLPALPMLAYRLAGLPVPSVPRDADDLRDDQELVDGAAVLARAERADELLVGFLAALSIIAAGAAVTLATTGGLPGICLAAVVGLLLLIRSRWLLSVAQRVPFLLAGAVALAAVVAACFVAAGPLVRVSVILGVVLATAAAALGYAMVGVGRRHSPVWGRTLEILDVILVLGVLPLVVWVAGLYSVMRSLRG